MLNSNWVNPVVLPPGRARLATKPRLTGSVASTNTIGTVLVTCCNAPTAVPPATSTIQAAKDNDSSGDKSSGGSKIFAVDCGAMNQTNGTKTGCVRVLGVDPAAVGPMGYGVVESDGRLCKTLHYGALRVQTKRQKEFGYYSCPSQCKDPFPILCKN